MGWSIDHRWPWMLCVKYMHACNVVRSSTFQQGMAATSNAAHSFLAVITGLLTARGFVTGAVLLGAMTALSACQMGLPGSTKSTTELAEALNEYRIVPVSRGYINAPTAVLVLERDLGIAIEQRITLPNSTSLAGENTIQLRAQSGRSASSTRLVLRDVLVQFGGPPSPFSNVTDSGLTTRSDPYGDITYAVLRPGGDIVCVLAFRRTQTGGRALPRGSTALDLMMRNCVAGSIEQALSPLGPTAFGLGLPAGG